MKHGMKLWIVAGVMVGSLHAGTSGFNWGGSGDAVAFFDNASAQIEQRVSHKKNPKLNRIYKELFYAPIWVKAKGLSPFGNRLLRLIRTDSTLPSPLAIYSENQVVRRQVTAMVSKQGGTMADKIALELAMSKLYLHYAQYRINGGISWRPFARKLDALTEDYKIKVGWVKYAPPATAASVINSALEDGYLARAFHVTEPTRFGYAKLKHYLKKYIRISRQGGWPILPRFGTLKPGARHAKVIPLIRKHLAIVGDLDGCTEPMDSPKYDACLVKAVKRFQLRHGLKGDGVIGRQGRAALNMTVTQAIQKIRLNLDRIKWLYRKQEKMRIELNIPSFRLNFLDGNKLVTTIRVITGKPNHPTPSFHNKMTYIVVNPYWKIPEGIVRSEMLGKLIRDPYHYEAQGKELHETWDENSPRVDPGTVNWAKYRDKSKHIPYRFMQVPSRHNALGKIKFLFPNGYSVYIHDTPSKSLFFRNVRAFSHGCMRIQKPRELLESLALFNDNIDVDSVMKQLEGTEKKTISLKHKVPIDITYLTAYVDPYGYLNFRKDVYHYDKYQMKDYTPKCTPLAKSIPDTKEMPPSAIKAPKTPAKKTAVKPKINKAKQKTKKKPSANLSPLPRKLPKVSSPRIAQKSPTASDMLKAAKRPGQHIDEDGYQISEVY